MRIVRQPPLTRISTAAIAIAIVMADQLTKAWAQRALADGSIEIIEGFLTFRLTFNSGAAFSSFVGLGSVIAFLAVGISVFLWVAAARSERSGEWIVFALIIGGAMGNAIDRFLRGEGLADGSVVDFIDVGFIPVFNIADSAITVGVVLALFLSFLPGAKPQSPDHETNDAPTAV